MNKKFKLVTAVTIGDPAGIGPEIVVGAMLDEEAHECCGSFVIGSVTILDRAAKILGRELRYNKIEDPSEALFQYRTMNVLETGDYGTDPIWWREIQELTDRVPIDQIMKSIELGMDHRVNAVFTTLIHKRATRLARVEQPGHAEIYQGGTHSSYALTIFSCHRLRVFFVSRHMSLVDTCGYATKERVPEFAESIDKELKKTGIMEPLIAVATLNPHGGDNGLLGAKGIGQLVPTVGAARAEGINTVRPVPADSIFRIGKSGKYDAILFLYHDQGHITYKTLDFEKSVTLTFGLPFIRSSVDHETAFDIAGKGIVGSISLIEPTRVVAEYAMLMRRKTDQ